MVTLERDNVNSLWIRNKSGFADFEVDAITYCATQCIEPIEYCVADNVSTEYEYIRRVKAGGIYNWSGDDNGYGDYTYLSDNLPRGQYSSIRLTPGFYGQSYIEYWTVYIDFDQDGEFESHEQVYRGRGRREKAGHIYVPSWATTGETRMRVVMKYGGYGHPCSDHFEGETEDYTVNIGAAHWITGNETSTNKSSADKAYDKAPVVVDRSDALPINKELRAKAAAIIVMKVYPNPARGPVKEEIIGIEE